MEPRFGDRGTPLDLAGAQIADNDASMEPRFGDRGTAAIKLLTRTLEEAASMEPRFGDRGTGILGSLSMAFVTLQWSRGSVTAERPPLRLRSTWPT